MYAPGEMTDNMALLREYYAPPADLSPEMAGFEGRESLFTVAEKFTGNRAPESQREISPEGKAKWNHCSDCFKLAPFSPCHFPRCAG